VDIMQHTQQNEKQPKTELEKIKIKKCLRCGKLFKVDNLSSDLCPYCIKLDNEDFEKIRDYLYEHKTATYVQLSEATGISVMQIERYLRNGRLEIPEGSPIYIKCERCGAEIKSGRICNACSLSLSNAMRLEMNYTDAQVGDTPKKKSDNKAKMHYFNFN